jgi:hypothetical protein
MTARPTADPWCCRIVALAARLLPAEQRQRYAIEFIAELYGMPRARQWRHSLQVLTSALTLRSVLKTAGPTTDQKEIWMTTPVRRPLACRVGLHRWEEQENPETKERYEICLRCDAYRERPGAAPGAGAAGVIGGGMP